MAAARKTEYLIIGNSAGGIGAAEAIREVDRSGAITIISDEPYPTYSRPLISEYLAHPDPVEKYLYRDADFYKKNGIEARLGERVIGIDPGTKTVKLDSGQTLGWEKLLVASGGAPIVPPMEGTGLKGVFTFNRLDDARAIDEFLGKLRHKPRAVVIGGGLIGVSVTEALVKRNIAVSIIEMLDRILSAMLDEETSAIEDEALRQAGVNIITGHTAVKINSGTPGHVSGVSLDDGRMLHCDLVIVAIGVRPRLEAVKDAGLEINRGIVVDSHMATSIPDIYACGDVAEAYDFVLGENRLTPVLPNAYEGGRVAGLNMAGEKAEYRGGTAMNAMKYFGVHIVSAGVVTPPAKGFEVLSHRKNGVYRKVVLKGRKVAGLVFAGDIEKSGIIYHLMKDGTDVSRFKQALVTDEFGLATLPAKVRRARLRRPEGAGETGVTHIDEPEELPIGD